MLKGKHDKNQGENAHGDEKGGVAILDGGLGHIPHQVPDKHRNDGGRNGIARAAELYQLVTPLAAAAQGVQHGIDHRVQHAHGETGHEGTNQINAEGSGDSRKEHDGHPHKTDSDGPQGGFFVTQAFQHHTGRNAHERIGDKIGEITELRHEVTDAELVFHNDSERILKPGDERNHRKKTKHHCDRQGIALFVFHNKLF